MVERKSLCSVLYPLILAVLSSCDQLSPATESPISLNGHEDVVITKGYSDGVPMRLSEYAWLLAATPADDRKKLLSEPEALKEQIYGWHSDYALEKELRDNGFAQREDIAAKVRVAMRTTLVTEYVNHLRDTMAKPDNLTELARERYLSDPKRQLLPEARKVAHILLPGRDPSSKFLIDVQKALAQGTPFSEVAKKHSIDQGTAPQGGLLPQLILRNGTLDPEFERAAFETRQGKTSAPIFTEFGTHLVNVVEVKPGRKLEFSEIQSMLEEEAFRDYVRTQIKEKLLSKHPDADTINLDALHKYAKEKYPEARAAGKESAQKK